MTDEIKLPQLPMYWDSIIKEPWRSICEWAESGIGWISVEKAEKVNQGIQKFAEDYARAAVLADRQAREVDAFEPYAERADRQARWISVDERMTISDTQKQRLDRCIKFLSTFALPDSEIGDIHWIGARNADPEAGESYCYECGHEEVNRLNAEHPDHEYFLDGGWSIESDSQEFCETCGKYLHTSLTSYAVAQELNHWCENRITLRGKSAPYQAYELLRVLECAYMGDPVWESNYERERINDIQHGVHRLTRRIDAVRIRAEKRAIETEAKEQA